MDDYLLSSNKIWREKNGNKMKNDDNACKALSKWMNKRQRG
jgi:hypothetical protein